MDDWIEDEAVLREITRTKDVHGEWWDIPVTELCQCMLAQSYLDAHGIEFYLPAYMVAVLQSPEAFDGPRKSSAWQVTDLLDPNTEVPELRDYFLLRFSRIVGGRKDVCRTFLQYMSTSTLYDDHACKIAKEALAHEFWAIDS